MQSYNDEVTRFD